MKEKIKGILRDSSGVKTRILENDDILGKIQASAETILSCLGKGGKVLIFGNGGSAADSQHFAAELVGRFQNERRALAAVALTTDTSILTALANDYSYDAVFKRQIEALAGCHDVAFAISTSGMAKNVLEAAKLSKHLGLRTIGLTGKDGGELAKLADIPLIVPSSVTARIQETHIAIIHILCELVEDAFKK